MDEHTVTDTIYEQTYHYEQYRVSLICLHHSSDDNLHP